MFKACDSGSLNHIKKCIDICSFFFVHLSQFKEVHISSNCVLLNYDFGMTLHWFKGDTYFILYWVSYINKVAKVVLQGCTVSHTLLVASEMEDLEAAVSLLFLLAIGIWIISDFLLGAAACEQLIRTSLSIVEVLSQHHAVISPHHHIVSSYDGAIFYFPPNCISGNTCKWFDCCGKWKIMTNKQKWI